VWMLERILPPALTLALWALLAFVAGYYFGGFGRRADAASSGQRVARGVGLFAMAYGLIMLAGAAAGGSDPLQPLKGMALATGGGPAAGTAALPFRKITSVADLDRELAAAGAAGQPVMVDFYADWCVSCKEMEKYTFTDGQVRADLGAFVLLKADVTANNAADQALMRRFGIFGPPATAFFSPEAGECRNFRLVGFVSATDFRNHLAAFHQECQA
jgi:thioredoxin:protein disulfide reductase